MLSVQPEPRRPLPPPNTDFNLTATAADLIRRELPREGSEQ